MKDTIEDPMSHATKNAIKDWTNDAIEYTNKDAIKSVATTR